MKKFLLLCSVMLCVLSAKAQSFVDVSTAEVLVQQEYTSDLDRLNSLNPTSGTYAKFKLNLESYDLFLAQLEGNPDVGDAIKTTVIEVRSGNNAENYDQDSFNDPQLLELKNHLIQLLSK